MRTSTLTRSVRRAAGALVLVGAVVASTPGTAAAAPPQRFEFDTVDEFDFPVCGGAFGMVHVRAEESGRGTIHVRHGQSYYNVKWSGHNTLTNPISGKSVNLYADFNDKDSKITDNGDGTITIEYRSIVNERDYGPDGTLGLKTSGKFELVTVIDLMGTPDDFDDDVVLSDELVRFSGRNDRDDTDFCVWFGEVTA